MAPALSETGIWTPPELEAPTRDDKINTSLTYGFIFDMCGIEIDPLTYQVRVDRYVSMHDAGRIMNPMIATARSAAPSRKALRRRSTRSFAITRKALSFQALSPIISCRR